jgi:plasmid replication initiation protein
MERIRVTSDQLDLFIFSIADFRFRDQRETMERPFFSLAKNKRLKPIEYETGGIVVKVQPHQDYGMATIWDADILIWAASRLIEIKNSGRNDIPEELHFHPHDLLKAIRRDVGGDHYKRLYEALMRLRTTNIKTNIRAPRGRQFADFSWISEVRGLVDENDQPKGMSIVLSKWFRDGVLEKGGVLAIDPAYFSIKGGRERWLYRVARKHAGDAGPDGFAMYLSTLFEKSGAEGTYRRFKFEMNAIVRRNALPSIHLQLEAGSDPNDPKLRMVMREAMEETQSLAAPAKRPRKRKEAAKPAAAPALPLFNRNLSDDVLSRIRKDFRGWDVYALKSEFDAWIDERPAERTPKNYEAAFYGFVRQHDRKHGA